MYPTLLITYAIITYRLVDQIDKYKSYFKLLGY